MLESVTVREVCEESYMSDEYVSRALDIFDHNIVVQPVQD